MSRIAPVALSLLFALALGGLVVAVAAEDPRAAFAAFGAGVFGGWDALSEVCVKTCPLLLTGLAIAVAFRAGIWNIGGEGQLLAGATVMAWVGTAFGGLPALLALPLALASSAAAGAAWASIAAWLKLRRRVSEVISTIMLNFVALWLLSYLVNGPLMEHSGAYPQSDSVAQVVRLPKLFTGFRVHAGILLGLVLAGGIFVVMFHTVVGFHIRAVGANPVAARLAGISTDRVTFFALALSGSLAGLAGGIEIVAVTFRLFERFSPGYGFTAIAVALLGRLHPGGVVLAALLFGALETGSSAMQRTAGVSSVLVSVVQAAVIFGMLAAENMDRWISSARSLPSPPLP